MKLRKAGRGSSAVAEATSRVGIQAAVAAAVAGAVTIRVRAMAVSVMEEMLQKRKAGRPCPNDRHQYQSRRHHIIFHRKPYNMIHRSPCENSCQETFHRSRSPSRIQAMHPR